MPNDCVSYQSSGFFTSLITDYLNQNENLKSFYNRFPLLDNFEQQIHEKHANFDHTTRAILVATLLEQYKNCSISEATRTNILTLKNDQTFTVTTGHQLNIFTGPLYFIYKICSTIILTNQLKLRYPKQHFVPIYWMATEDHDFEEIRYFSFKGKKFNWNKDANGPVGKLDTKGIEDVFRLFSLELGQSDTANYLKDLFESSYLKHNNLSEATRYLANALFSKYGLVILDAEVPELKSAFIPFVKKEILEQFSFQKVSETIAQLKPYTIQVHPRPLNLFYLSDHFRERIIYEDGIYKVNNTDLTFTTNAILNELETHPEQFSPNVLLRPLYQEVILPNLTYIGGGGELAYWLELKAMFNSVNITFPMLLLRNSVLLATQKQAAKADKLGLNWHDLFEKQAQLLTHQTQKVSKTQLDFSALKVQLNHQFKTLYDLSNKTDASFLGALKAQEAKQMKGIENLEKRMLKAQKKVHEEHLKRVKELQNQLFPLQGLQERQDNFSSFYVEFGPILLSQLMEELQPLAHEFKVLVF